MPKISIIVPVYNVESFLEESLDSLLNQTFEDFEAICVNDGSTDQSGKILEQYAKKDTRIKVITQNNKGVSAARNAALEVINGEYVAFFDPDDVMHPQFLEIMLGQIQKTQGDIVWCDFKRIKENDKITKFNILKNINSINIPDHFEKFINRRRPCPTVTLWNKLYRVSILKNTKFSTDLSTAEDFVFMHPVLHHAHTMYYIKETLIYYRMRSSSISRSKLEERYIDDHIKAIKILTTNCRDLEVSDRIRKKLHTSFQKLICKACIYIPYREARKNKEYYKFWEKYSVVMTDLLRDGTYNPKVLDLRNRFLTFLFLNKRFRLLELALKI